MSLVDSSLISLLVRALDLTAQRQQLVAQNIANVDTPGYHTRDIDFRGELQRALWAGQADPAAGGAPFVREVPGLIERPDGNNVSIDRESLLMAGDQLQFQTEAALLRSEFSRLQEAISGGGGQ
ncbi:MAG TPA: flagellar basal body protein [Candidatus Binatia bacterium]|nr:flagellar basal body protein [Candidatus Binatia bacterium]